MTIWDTRSEYDSRAYEWRLARAMLGGTPAMRGESPSATSVQLSAIGASGSSEWLPRMPSDSDQSYWMRWDRAYFFGAFSDTVSRIAAKQFAEPINVDGGSDLTEQIVSDADRAGTTLHQLAHVHSATKLAFGSAGIIVAMPGTSSLPADALDPAGRVHEAGRSRFKVRPFLRRVHPMNVQQWAFEDDADGVRRLVYLVIRCDGEERDGEGKWATIKRAKVYEIGEGGIATVQDVREGAGADGQMTVVAGEPMSLGVPWIPFVCDMALLPGDDQDESEMTARSPLADLMWINYQHFRETAEQGVALLFARSEAPVEMGCAPADEAKRLDWGLGKAKRTSTPPDQYRIQFVGPSGKGVELGAASLADIESRMVRMMARPMQRTSGQVTATGAVMDESGSESAAEAMSRGTEQALMTALRMAEAMATGQAEYSALLPDLTVDIVADFAFGIGDSVAKGTFLQGLYDGGLLTKRHILGELKSLKLLSEETDVDALIAELDEDADVALERQVAAMDRMAARPPKPIQGEADVSQDGAA